MHPRELVPSLSPEDAKDHFIELVQENRSLRLALVKYVVRYGIMPELGGPQPKEAVDAPVAEEAPEAEPPREEIAADGDTCVSLEQADA